jgi:hypothetical protein
MLSLVAGMGTARILPRLFGCGGEIPRAEGVATWRVQRVAFIIR